MNKLSKLLKAKWNEESFRTNNYIRMTTNNPAYNEDVVERANQTRLKNGSYRNNYKYGNGKISYYEQQVMQYLLDKGFYYNYAIPTKIARHAFPDKHYAVNYKPDFVNLQYKICIEIDGHTHDSEEAKKLDAKKTECLNFLGFTVYRFTHKQIDNGQFFMEVEKLWENL